MQRDGFGPEAHEFYRESFMDELARAVGKDPYLYRRELLARTNLPYKADMITGKRFRDLPYSRHDLTWS
jgi:hypothetical protein